LRELRRKLLFEELCIGSSDLERHDVTYVTKDSFAQIDSSFTISFDLIDILMSNTESETILSGFRKY
jgi:hypothetical protein